MAAASVSLLSEGMSRSVSRVSAGALAGAAFVWLTRRVLGHSDTSPSGTCAEQTH
jgi:hypothetical protein